MAVTRKTIDKFCFIENYLKDHLTIDIMDEKFVQAYIDKFNPKYAPQMVGAHKCSQISRILSQMYNSNLLSRNRIGLGGTEPGFPKWVYVYQTKYYDYRGD